MNDSAYIYSPRDITLGYIQKRIRSLHRFDDFCFIETNHWTIFGYDIIFQKSSFLINKQELPLFALFGLLDNFHSFPILSYIREAKDSFVLRDKLIIPKKLIMFLGLLIG